MCDHSCVWFLATQVTVSHSTCGMMHCFTLVAACVLQGTFSDLSALLEEALQRPPEGVADGILLDLGMSSMQAGTLWTSPCKSTVPPDNVLQPGGRGRCPHLVCSIPGIDLWSLPSRCTVWLCSLIPSDVCKGHSYVREGPQRSSTSM